MRKRIVFTLSFLFYFAGSLRSLDIECPVPGGPFFSYKAKPHSVSHEAILNDLFGDMPYSMSLSINYSAFRRFYSRDGNLVVETGFPGYTGIFYTETTPVDESYFLSRLARYFGTSNMTLPPVAVTESGGKTTYRTQPRNLDGIPVLFDAEHAGDGAEMTVENGPEGARISLKFSWHEPLERTAVTNSIRIETILRECPDLAGKKVTGIVPCYYYSAEDSYQPAVKVVSTDNVILYFDLLSHQYLPKFRLLTGR